MASRRCWGVVRSPLLSSGRLRHARLGKCLGFKTPASFPGAVKLDSPETDIKQWLAGLDDSAGLKDPLQYIIPGHGTISEDAQQVVEATRNYILYVREAMARAVRDFVPFDEAYRHTDWSRYENLPAFDASNRGNAYRIYLDGEARSLQ